MIHSLDIGKFIYNRLSSVCPVYPLIAENGAQCPFFVYRRDSLSSSFCKDGLYEDILGVTITIVTDSYYSGVSKAQLVREKLTIRNFEYEDMLINSQLDTASESYAENEYIQTLNFQIIINNK